MKRLGRRVFFFVLRLMRQGVEQRRSRCRKAMEAEAGTAEDPAAFGGTPCKFWCRFCDFSCRF